MKILFRVDASNAIGTGHLYECLWFAQEMQPQSMFCIREHKPSKALVKRLGFPVVEITKREQDTQYEYEKINRLVERFRPDVVIVDLPYLTQEYLNSIRPGKANLVVFNALLHPVKAPTHIATVFSPHPKNKQYSGPQYVLLRKAFAVQKPVKLSPVVRNILVMFGGADPQNFTLKTLKALHTIPDDVRITVVLGGAFKGAKSVMAFLKTLSKKHRLFQNVHNDATLLQIMKGADLAFVSGGYTLSELMRLGIPCIALAQNFTEEHRTFPNFPKDAFIYLGRGTKMSISVLRKTAESLMQDFKKRRALGRKAAQVVDGKGLARVCDILKKV